MKILLCSNFLSEDYPADDIVQWLNDILCVSCQIKKKDWEVIVCLDKSLSSRFTPLGSGTLLNSGDYTALLSNQLHGADFDVILTYGRNDALEKAAIKFNKTLFSFFKSPYPLDGWLLDSTWHRRALRHAIFDSQSISCDHCRSDMMNVIPSFARYYNRFSPYTGSFAKEVYDKSVRKVVVPVFCDYRRFTDKQSPADGSICNLNSWIKSILPFEKRLLYLIVPMEDHFDMSSLGLSMNENEFFRWLTPAEAKNQLLTLIDKADCVLALDAKAAVLPMLMGKWTCGLPDMSDISAELPSFVDWIANGAKKARMNCERCFRRQRFILNCCIVPKTAWVLQSICEKAESDDMESFIQANQMQYCLLSDYTPDESGIRKRNRWRRKLRKLWRDPYKYFDDSKYPCLRKLKFIFG